MSLYAQNDIRYDYDENGNRTKRILLDMGKKSIAAIDTTLYDEAALEEKLSVNEDLGDSQISFFPNPVKQWLNIKIAGDKVPEMGDYRILNSNAKVVTSGKMESNNRIDFNDYPVGLYLLQIEIGNKIQTWKIIKD
jgi:hypothetical protein